MRIFLFALGIYVAALAMLTPAEAQNYPWCAMYNMGDQAVNCGFTTFQQCLDTVRGIGGFCEPNTQYVPPPGLHPSTRVRRPY